MDAQIADIIHLIMMLLDTKCLFRFGRCSQKFYQFVTDEKLWQVKLLAEYLIKPDVGMSALQSYKFCIYAGRKKSTGYDLFMINELKELKAQKVGTAQRMSQSLRKWKTISPTQKDQWKNIASDQGQNAAIHHLWLALSEKEREKFGIAAANYKRKTRETLVHVSKKKGQRKHKQTPQILIMEKLPEIEIERIEDRLPEIKIERIEDRLPEIEIERIEEGGSGGWLSGWFWW